MSTRTNYTLGFKQNAVKQHLASSRSYPQSAVKLGLSQSTLYYWVQKYASTQLMTKSNKKEWMPEQMLEAIMKTASMNEQELGEYLRSNGLLSSELEEFKNEFINLKKEKKRGRPQLDPELVKLRKENKKMESDIKRKDRALAEYCARVILLKKSHEIWGTNEDDE